MQTSSMTRWCSGFSTFSPMARKDTINACPSGASTKTQSTSSFLSS